ncbi:hypothetical protein ACFFX1_47785 [Dactylosporangium sucinum]|uniref:Uncharacterized protein n=1 Tax=Dactylosporangium sucinum TaxID=1424081 RepID=A0A917WSZ1_9ACTN|nr:hypothetical protein [Dactylosporangium sucinum]GGM29201.1 hypothetical protein GCM10007977_033120 [Dactylosporangium sucinum]
MAQTLLGWFAARLVLLSDTHAPRSTFPPVLWPLVSAADLVVHAGDWMTASLLDELPATPRR